jgi:hypothetical protein
LKVIRTFFHLIISCHIKILLKNHVKKKRNCPFVKAIRTLLLEHLISSRTVNTWKEQNFI